MSTSSSINFFSAQRQEEKHQLFFCSLLMLQVVFCYKWTWTIHQRQHFHNRSHAHLFSVWTNLANLDLAQIDDVLLWALLCPQKSNGKLLISVRLTRQPARHENCPIQSGSICLQRRRMTHKIPFRPQLNQSPTQTLINPPWLMSFLCRWNVSLQIRHEVAEMRMYQSISSFLRAPFGF